MKLYYEREKYPFIVYYKDINTKIDVHTPTDSREEYKDIGFDYVAYERSMTVNALEIEGYSLVGDSSQLLTIHVDDKVNPKLNVVTFYYQQETGALRLSKTVETYPTALLPDMSYDFTVRHNGENVQFPYAVYTYKVYSAADDSFVEERTAQVNVANKSFVVSLKHGEYAVINTLPVGSYTVTEKDYTTQAFDAVAAQNVVITTDETSSLDFVNTYRPTGDLSITKTVNAEGGIASMDKVERFDFHVILATTDYDGEVVASFSGTNVNREDETIAIVDGKFDVSLADGETVLLHDLPAVVVTVAEADYSDKGYEETITYDNADKRIPTDGLLKVDCVNMYPVKLGTITVTKTISNLSAVPAGDEQSFIFHVNGKDVDMDVVIRMADIRANGGAASVTIHSVPLGTYTITEDTSWSWRYTCTNPTQAVTLNADITAVSASFVNTYNNNNWMNDYHYVDNAFTKSTR